MNNFKIDFSKANQVPRMLDAKEWEAAVNSMDFVFQPIVNIRSGSCIGFEALLREYEKADFHSIDTVFNTAYSQDVLTEATILLLDKTIEKYAASGCAAYAKLFVNFDSRILPDIKCFMIALDEMLKRHDVLPSSVVLEISEKFEITYNHAVSSAFASLKNKGLKIALDDYGTRFSGPQLLYSTDPQYIKIDRFFISGINADVKKKLFATNLVNTAHMLGIFTVAEGVETVEEFYICKELGFDMAQGHLVQSPGGFSLGNRHNYPYIEELNRRDKRAYGSDNRLIFSLMEHINPVRLFSWNPSSGDVLSIFSAFRENKDLRFIPVVNEEDGPMGMVHESKIKDYIYSAYGMSLLKNKGTNMAEFITPCPVAEISTSVDSILESFSLADGAEGVLITKEGKYAGFLCAKSLLRIMYEKNIAIARDQNPLSKLPGNSIINEFITKAVDTSGNSYIFAYFDFNNFKPFNDHHGFRKGDKAILIFADILRELQAENALTGHVGGDDFFAGFRDDMPCFTKAIELIKSAIAKFARQVADLYTPEERAKEFITSKDREGNVKLFPLLTVSAAVLNIPRGERIYTMEDISFILADLKKTAKQAENGLAIATLGNTPMANAEAEVKSSPKQTPETFGKECTGQ
ncbi:MAG: GGDEF domain-containing protein [Nitrospinae bacterium]|nr:GGDEF domain-containing protein [Nitrospinota bacterium]